jgi:predicted enzyme related to lactoylglutathione lyase
MSHPIVHTEIRSQDPDATRTFFADLFGWKVASEGAFPGYTFIDTGAEGGPYLWRSARDKARRTRSSSLSASKTWPQP